MCKGHGSDQQYGMFKEIQASQYDQSIANEAKTDMKSNWTEVRTHKTLQTMVKNADFIPSAGNH
jgi:hypothetical protein